MTRVAQIFQKCRSHLEILDIRRICSKFHTEYPLVLCTTLQNLVTWVIPGIQDLCTLGYDYIIITNRTGMCMFEMNMHYFMETVNEIPRIKAHSGGSCLCLES
jgi:hypothetical protein